QRVNHLFESITYQIDETTTAAISIQVWNLLFIGIAFALAVAIHLLSNRISLRIMQLSRLAPRGRQLRSERQRTLQGLISSAVTFFAFAVAILFSIARFVGAETVIWVVGLFSAAFGLGARPIISDFLTGISFLFEDPFDVGDKVEIMGVEGIVEEVNLRTMALRAPTGELYVIPNGEVRLIRNFSRGRFSSAKVTLKIASEDLSRALPLLEEMGKEAIHELPNLLEPWQVLSESGVIGQQTELTLTAKARFGQAAEMKPRLLALVQERLEEAGVSLSN
ncbi:MAG TPA: mechanosensitive ion channel family protein, partial [Anaerolineae bacterium]